jgi:signal transduction histidine kinase/CheY-like chemotaxis protein
VATILHVYHDEATQKILQRSLGEQYSIISATDGPTAIQYCAMIQPDLIVMDLDLPDVAGYELTSRLKMFMPQTPVLTLVTANTRSRQAQTAVTGSDAVLTKPIDPIKLAQIIQGLLPQPIKLPDLSISSNELNEQLISQFQAQIAALNQANRRLASLNAISALIGTSLDLQHLMDQILGQIFKTIDFDSATLFLRKGNLLEAAASRGLSEHQRGMNIYTKSEQNSAWRVVDNKLPLIINNVLESKYWEPRPELSQVRSWLGVPLIYKDRVVGVLTLDKNEVEGFTDADARYVFTLAYQIAIAVENAQLFEEWESQATRLKLINEVAQEITTILDVNNLYDALAWAIFERLHYDRVAIFEVDGSRSNLILRAYYGEFIPQLDVDVYQQMIEGGFIGRAVKTAMPILVNDISKEDEIFPFEGTKNRSSLAIPIFVGNQVEAVINVDSYEVNGFTDQDLWTLSSLVSQAATVIENARLYHGIDAYSNKLERIVDARTQRLQAIRKISQVVSQGLDVDELLTVVGKGISQIFTQSGSGVEVKVMIGLVNGSRLTVRQIYNAAQMNKDDKQDKPYLSDDIREFTYKINYQTPAGQVIKNSKSLFLNNVDSKEVYSPPTGNKTGVIDSIIIAPLITTGKTIGMIVVESQMSEAFDESDLETLEILAFQVASAIEHARLLRKTRELAIVDERTRLARDMHDGVAQNLAYLLIQVDRCLSMVDEESKLGKQLDQISLLLTRNIEEIRRNIFDLRPVDLEGKSLFEVLENFVAEFGRRWNLETTCLIRGKVEDVPTEVESALYRILQETLSNARKHAQCTQIAVELSVQGDQWIALEIKDNGCGFDPDQTHQSLRKTQGRTRGLGLISMRERAEQVGGKLIVESIKDQGTRIFAMLPLSLENLREIML